MLRFFCLFALASSLTIVGCGDDASDGPETDGAVVQGDGGIDARVDETCDTPGAVEDVPCGACGTTTRFCTSEQVWEYGACTGESGVCQPGTSRDASCGSCGSVREICTSACLWEAAGTCTGEGECAPGALIRSGEGCASGERDLRCSDSCEYEPISECVTETCDTPGATEATPCGNCGTRTRFCTAALEWEYGACEAEGVCAPGSTRTASCGNCGMQEERCGTECTWSAFGACADEGECAPGATTTTAAGCPAGQSRPMSCSPACVFEPAGMCVAPANGLGESCSPGSCLTGLTCSDDTGIAICRETCSSDAECTAPTVCFTGAGECSDDCTLWTHAGCPSGAKCDFLGSTSFLGGDPITICSGVGTLPEGATCMLNAECRRGFSCLLDSDTTATGKCRAVCDLVHTCPTGFTCDATGGGTGFCQPSP